MPGTRLAMRGEALQMRNRHRHAEPSDDLRHPSVLLSRGRGRVGPPSYTLRAASVPDWFCYSWSLGPEGSEPIGQIS